MKLIVGLGNPGKAYQNSRHNAGFLILTALAKKYRVEFKKEKDAYAQTARTKIGNEKVIFARPQTFMNLSGFCIKALLGKYKIRLEDLAVICDDLDLGLGRIKIKNSGSSGGHRGLKSIIDILGSNGFSRLRVGIGRPDSKIYPDAAEYVLSDFGRDERKTAESMINRACECIEIWVAAGITRAMDVFNAKTKVQKSKSQN